MCDPQEHISSCWKRICFRNRPLNLAVMNLTWISLPVLLTTLIYKSKISQEEIGSCSVLLDGKNECNIPVNSCLTLNIGFQVFTWKAKSFVYLFSAQVEIMEVSIWQENWNQVRIMPATIHFRAPCVFPKKSKFLGVSLCAVTSITFKERENAL